MRLPAGSPSRGTHVDRRVPSVCISTSFVEESRRQDTGRVETRVLKERVRVLPAVVHFSYSAAILAVFDAEYLCKRLGTSGADCATSMAYRGVVQ